MTNDLYCFQMTVTFQGKQYDVVITDHARLQMSLRGLTEQDVLNVIETGRVITRDSSNKFWVFRELKERKDNLISVSISVESPKLIVITTMVNWRPR